MSKPSLDELIESTRSKREETEGWMKVLLFGDPGVGKTRLAASAHFVEEMKPVLLVTAEGGLITLRKDSRFDDLDVIDLTEATQDPEKVMKRLEHVYDLIQDSDYRTVIVDTLSEVQRYGLHFISSQLPGWGAVMKPKKVTLPQYGASLVQTSVLVRAFRDLPKHVIMTTHTKRAHLETDGHDYIVPSLTGQQWKEAMAVFDEVWYLYTKAATSFVEPEKGVKFKILTKPFENIKAKDRAFDLPVVMDISHKYLEDILTCQSSS